MSENGSTNNDKRHFPLRIERMPDGGFVVSDTSFGGDPSRYCGPLFASSSIGEALAFICGRLDPEAFKAWQEQQAKAAHDAKAAEVSRDFAKASEPSSEPYGSDRPFVQRCARCGSSGMERYCSRCNRPATRAERLHGMDWSAL